LNRNRYRKYWADRIRDWAVGICIDGGEFDALTYNEKTTMFIGVYEFGTDEKVGEIWFVGYDKSKPPDAVVLRDGSKHG
jgi:hypothetical protein